jgi:hypothetical protein
VAHYEWSIGTDAGLDDTRAWEETAEPHIDVALSLDASAAHFLNLRARFGDGSADEVSSRAQPMFGEACAHRRFLLRADGVSLTRGEGVDGLTAFFAHAEQLQAEDVRVHSPPHARHMRCMRRGLRRARQMRGARARGA